MGEGNKGDSMDGVTGGAVIYFVLMPVILGALLKAFVYLTTVLVKQHAV